ncbi:hypothetical protein LCGC14_2954220 [marine sediment metagenome]|uniref:Uncharacterized protein n=1 Tax=marine sediment metagenome TaxID=412755 RepID=A0A0F8XE13_9ZZZZ
MTHEDVKEALEDIEGRREWSNEILMKVKRYIIVNIDEFIEFFDGE